MQARMSSTRLPGKTLKFIGNKTILDYQLEQLSHCRHLDDIIVATSIDESDDPLAEHVERSGYKIFRGPLLNVAERFQLLLKDHDCDFFARFCADRPLFDYRLLDSALQLAQTESYDIVTNAAPPTYPKGQTVEVISRSLYLREYENFVTPEDFEHVTHYFYRLDQEELRIHNLQCSDGNMNHFNLCIDTIEDLGKIEAIIQQTGEDLSHYTWQDFVRLYSDLTPQ